MHDIWRDCFGPQAKHIAFSTSNWYFSNYEMCIHGRFSKIQSHIENNISIYPLCVMLSGTYFAVHVHYV